MTVAHRNLIALVRTPTTLVFSTVQPIIFVLMFRYVFGGAIKIPNGSYVDYLMPGIFVQTVTFGSVNTGVGLATDLQNGHHRAVPLPAHGPFRGTGGPHRSPTWSATSSSYALMVPMGFLVGFPGPFRGHPSPRAPSC